MSAYANPVVINQFGHAKTLERIPLILSESGFSERWLQEVLFKNPQCLPTKEIDPRLGRLIPICMEIETGAGPADILYVTETGHLVLVETKLWRNPEARRVVVAQILDYAKQLTSWSFSDLARETAIASKQGPEYLLNCVKEAVPNLDEASFVDGLSNSLETGDFLLLIVGDGIRSGTESLVNFIEQYGNLRFGFGLLEVATFKLNTEETLIQPRLLAKTTILERTVLTGAIGPVTFEDVAEAEEVETDEKLIANRKWCQEFWQGFHSILKLDDTEQPIPSTLPKSTNFYFMMPIDNGNSWISAYIAQSSQSAGVYLTFAQSFVKVEEYYERLNNDKVEIEKTVGVELLWKIRGHKVYISTPEITYTDLNDPVERQEVQEYLANMSNKMVNAFRHRLEQYTYEDD